MAVLDGGWAAWQAAGQPVASGAEEAVERHFTGSARRERLVLREDIVPEGGSLVFKVADRNGNKKTRFVAKVAEGETNLEATSTTQKLR